ncbi:type VI secretion system Vgr family protein [Sorangium sp. So ce1153]|uniref:type VI secretion system Vgr family protein n=1 Tax=Sorangium sp. So ce1153 TaxID=3133333 RepID=UPI003F62055F
MEQLLSLSLDCSAIPAGFTATAATVLEAISQPTHATVELVGPGDLDLERPIGEKAHLALCVDGDPVRHFHLVVSAVRFDGVQHGHRRRYFVELVHELSLLSLRSDVRMFQEKDARAIVSEVLEGAGVPPGDVAWSVQRTLGKRTYCVQYRETDLSFASRLLEHEGIHYFIHDDGDGTHVTFADAQSSFPPIEGVTQWPILDGRDHGVGVLDFELETIATPEAASVGDYNFETPQLDLTSTHPGVESPRGERFEYAAGHRTPDEGAALAKIRCEEILARARVGAGHSDRWTFRAGSWFELENTAGAHLSQKYLLTAVRHEIVGLGLGPGLDSDDRRSYTNRFTAIPHATTFRVPRTAPRPRLRGAHSAVVTGPGGEIHTDKLGRMKGKFFWDRLGKDDDTSSRWMRVVQLPIGGSMALARMTWEMSIVYFDGDPDRPIAVSRMYNAEKASPYPYPAAKTRMALQTASSPASGKSNEIRMEDGGGGQEFFVNASKDFDGQTNNNKTEKVGVDERVEVGVDEQITIGASQTVSIGANQTSTVTADQGIQVTSDRTVSIGASEAVSVSGNISQLIAGSDTETTGGSHTTLAALGIDKTATSSYSLTVGGSMLSAAGMGVSVAVAGARSETVGGAKITASGSSVTESVVGAYAATVGGACVHAAAANRVGGTKGPAAVTVGGLASMNAAGKVAINAKKINILVGGVANLLGGGGVLTLTPGSASFAGLITLDASGSIKISGNPNLVG